MRRTVLKVIAGVAAGLALLSLFPIQKALAQSTDFPNKPVRIMYPFAAGGGMEVVLRTMADRMQRSTGQPFLIENRTGAGGSIAAHATATAKPDGYTLFVGPVGITAITPHLRQLPYDTTKALTPVARLSQFNSVYVVSNELPVKTVSEFIAYAKANPGKVTFATSGVGSQGHLGGEILQKNWGIEMTHVPYKGASEIMVDLIAGRIDFSSDVTMLQAVKQGKARLLAVQYDERLPDFPDVPTVGELDIPKPGTGGTWFGAFAPQGTPETAIQVLAAEFEKALQDPQVAEQMKPFAMLPAFEDPAAFRERWEHDYETYGAVVRDLDLKLD